jgi:hypothetical protein
LILQFTNHNLINLSECTNNKGLIKIVTWFHGRPLFALHKHDDSFWQALRKNVGSLKAWKKDRIQVIWDSRILQLVPNSCFPIRIYEITHPGKTFIILHPADIRLDPMISNKINVQFRLNVILFRKSHLRLFFKFSLSSNILHHKNSKYVEIWTDG